MGMHVHVGLEGSVHPAWPFPQQGLVTGQEGRDGTSRHQGRSWHCLAAFSMTRAAGPQVLEVGGQGGGMLWGKGFYFPSRKEERGCVPSFLLLFLLQHGGQSFPEGRGSFPPLEMAAEVKPLFLSVMLFLYKKQPRPPPPRYTVYCAPHSPKYGPSGSFPPPLPSLVGPDGIRAAQLLAHAALGHGEQGSWAGPSLSCCLWQKARLLGSW